VGELDMVIVDGGFIPMSEYMQMGARNRLQKPSSTASRSAYGQRFFDAADIGYSMVCHPDYAVAKGLNPKLHLVHTNPHSGVRRRTRRVCRWRDKPMAKPWAAAAMPATEKNFRRVMDHKDMWALKAILDGKSEKTVDRREKVA
jgi:hypothetical protein